MFTTQNQLSPFDTTLVIKFEVGAGATSKHALTQPDSYLFSATQHPSWVWGTMMTVDVDRIIDVQLQYASCTNVAPPASFSLRDGCGSGQQAAAKADNRQNAWNDRDSSHHSLYCVSLVPKAYFERACMGTRLVLCRVTCYTSSTQNTPTYKHAHFLLHTENGRPSEKAKQNDEPNST